MNRGLAAMVRKEFRQILRDPRTLGILLMVPLLLLVLFGYAISTDVESITVGVMDDDRTPESRRIAELFRVLDIFDPGGVYLTQGEAEEALVTGHADAVVIIPPGFGRSLSSGEHPSIQVLVDGSNVTVAGTAQNYIEAALTDLSIRLITEWRMPQPPTSLASLKVDFRPRIWYNPELRSTVFLVPGLVAFIMVITAVISTALSVVREKEKGTMEMLEAAPLGSLALILGKTIPYMAISLAETGLILIAGRYLFGVQVQGSLAALAGITFLFLLSCLGMGLLISTVANTQQTAFLIATVVTVLPSFILSGFVFPIRNMPPVVRFVTHIIPARYFLIAERALIIRGADISSIWPQALALTLFSVVTLGISSVRLGRHRGQK